MKDFIIINLLIINFIKGNYIKLNFYKDKYKSSYQIDNVFLSNIVTDIYFGTPEFKITMQISTDSPYFVVKGSNSPNEYNQEYSSSFYFIKYGYTYEYKNIYFHSIFFQENFRFNKDIINLNSMMYWGLHPINHNYGLIGLQLYDNRFHENNIFINQLYDKGIITKKLFSLIYENEDKGELFIGDYPTNKTKLLYGKKFKICNNTFISNGDVYATIFDEIKFREIPFIFRNIKTKNINYQGIFSNTYYGYIGSKEYNEFVYLTFFKPKLVTKSCWIQNVDDDKFFGYVCAKRVDTSSIPSVKLYHKEFDFTFEIEKEEMWKDFNNIKYFLIFFSYTDRYSWILGQKFLEKYTFVFNGEKNIIGFYYSDKKIKNTYFKKFIMIVFVLIFIIIGIYIYKFLGIKKNKKDEDGFELEDLFNQKNEK